MEVDKEPIVDLENEQVLEPIEELIMEPPIKETTQHIIKDLIRELDMETEDEKFYC